MRTPTAEMHLPTAKVRTRTEKLRRRLEIGALLASVMDRIFNDNAVRVVSGKSSIVELIPQGYKDKMQPMSELTDLIKPSFQKEQDRIEAMRTQMFRDFAQGKIDQADEIRRDRFPPGSCSTNLSPDAKSAMTMIKLHVNKAKNLGAAAISPHDFRFP